MMKKFNINFMGKRIPALLLSGVFLLISVVSLMVQGLNLGLDFTGGTLVELGFDKPVVLQEVRELLTQNGLKRASLQQYGTDREILIRIPSLGEEESSGVKAKILQTFEASGQTITIRRVEFVGPSVGKELLEQGMLGIIAALIGILLYIMMRFEYRFAVGAVAALAHDALIVFGLYSIFRLEFDLTGLAAILTIVGYSINDTIVIYDRIRENLRKMRKIEPIAIVNHSLNETLARTINTSMTTLLVAISLYIWGGALIHNFALAMIVGIVSGTYSTIYMASAIALAMGLKPEDKPKDLPEEKNTPFLGLNGPGERGF